MSTKPATQIQQAIQQAEAEAQPYLHDQQRLAGILDSASRRASESHPFLLDCWESLQLLLRILRARLEGKYSVPASTSTMAVAAILYFINPIDLIPDSIPVFGLLDDAAVITFVTGANRTVIRNFRQWESCFGRTVNPYWKRCPA